MKAQVKRATVVRSAPRDGEDALAFDWDGAVRRAFLDGCLAEGVRAAVAEEALRDGVPPFREAKLRDLSKSASLKAALGWLRVETCLARHGELAALALERCLDETELDIRLRGHPTRVTAPRASRVLPTSTAAPALAVVRRGRERLDRFWTGTTFRAA